MDFNSGLEPTRRSLRVASQSYQRNYGKGGQPDISSWLIGGPQSQQLPPRISPWGSKLAVLDRQLKERVDNVSASFDNALESDSDADSNGELELETNENMKVILLDIQRNVKQINKKFDKMKKAVKDVQKSNSELQKQNVEMKETVNELKIQVGDLEKKQKKKRSGKTL